MKTTTPADAAAWADKQTPRYANLHRVTLGDPVPGSVKYRDTYLPTTATIGDKPEPHPSFSACTADACNGGRKPCPAPDACRVSEERLDAINAGVWRWVMACIAVWGCIALVLVLARGGK